MAPVAETAEGELPLTEVPLNPDNVSVLWNFEQKLTNFIVISFAAVGPSRALVELAWR